MLKILFFMFIFAALLFFVFLFVIFKVVKKAKAVSRSELAAKKCPACGKEFGDFVAEEAERNYLKNTAELWKRNPGIKQRLTSIWPVKCDKCDWKGTFEPAKHELLAEDVVIN